MKETFQPSVNYPTYRKGKSNNYFFKMISAEKCLALNSSENTCIDFTFASEYYLCNSTTECTKEKFESEYKKTIDRLNAIAL